MLEDEDDIGKLLGDPTAKRINGAMAAVSPKEQSRSRAVRVGRLDNMEAIGKEAASLYRRARRVAGDDITSMTASRLASVLKLVADVVQAGELARFEEIEARLAALEEARGTRRRA